MDRGKMLTSNLAALQELSPSLVDEAGKYALMRDGKLVHSFDSAADAHLFAREKFKDDRYSLHKINAAPIDLGYFSVMQFENS